MSIELNRTEAKQPRKTLVEEGTHLSGTLNSTCPVVVNGSVEGELEAPELTVAPSGSVSGAIKAKRIRSEGKLSGNVEAGSIYLSGSVGSNTVIKADTLEVKLGPGTKPLQVTFGECDLQVGDDPRKAREEPKAEGAVSAQPAAASEGSTGPGAASAGAGAASTVSSSTALSGSGSSSTGSSSTGSSSTGSSGSADTSSSADASGGRSSDNGRKAAREGGPPPPAR